MPSLSEIVRRMMHRAFVLDASYWQVRYESSLVIDNLPSCTIRSIEDGEQDIVDLAWHIPNEGAWLYIEPKRWYAITNGHSQEVAKSKSKSTIKYSASIPTGLKIPWVWDSQVTFYHTHPRASLQDMRRYVDRFGVSGVGDVEKSIASLSNGMQKKVWDNLLALYLSYPSKKDVMGFTSFSGPTPMKTAIATPYGISYFKTDSWTDIQNALGESDLQPFVFQSISNSVLEFMHVNHRLPTIEDFPIVIGPVNIGELRIDMEFRVIRSVKNVHALGI